MQTENRISGLLFRRGHQPQTLGTSPPYPQLDRPPPCKPSWQGYEDYTLGPVCTFYLLRSSGVVHVLLGPITSKRQRISAMLLLSIPTNILSACVNFVGGLHQSVSPTRLQRQRRPQMVGDRPNKGRSNPSVRPLLLRSGCYCRSRSRRILEVPPASQKGKAVVLHL